MSAIEKIKEKLQKYPHINFEEDENSIWILPTSQKGFTVTLDIGYDNIKVFFNGWHEDFESEEEALNCFAFGLSRDCRLKEFRRNDESYKWTLEYKENDEWIADGTTSLFNFAFWKKQTIHYLQNDLIK